MSPVGRTSSPTVSTPSRPRSARPRRGTTTSSDLAGMRLTVAVEANGCLCSVLLRKGRMGWTAAGGKVARRWSARVRTRASSTEGQVSQQCRMTEKQGKARKMPQWYMRVSCWLEIRQVDVERHRGPQANRGMRRWTAFPRFPLPRPLACPPQRRRPLPLPPAHPPGGLPSLTDVTHSFPNDLLFPCSSNLRQGVSRRVGLPLSSRPTLTSGLRLAAVVSAVS